MSETVVADSKFSIGRVFRLGFSAISANATVFAVLALIFAFAPAALFGLIRISMGIDDSDTLAQLRGVPGENIATTLLNLILMIGVVRGSVAYFKGRRATIGECLGAASGFLGLLGLSIIINIGVFVGLLLLIIPGLILYALWSVAMPAKIEERLGVGEALSRSADLSRGHRGPIIGLTLIWIAGAVGAFLVVGVVYGAMLALGSTADLVFEVILVPLITSAVSVLSSALSAATYYELKRIKEGDETIAAIFS